MREQLWTVVRFPNGSWATGGRPDDPEYSMCEIWQISSFSRREATMKAQRLRSRQKRAATQKGTND